MGSVGLHITSLLKIYKELKEDDLILLVALQSSCKGPL